MIYTEDDLIGISASITPAFFFTPAPALISAEPALVVLVRRITGLDRQITTYFETVERNFKEWIFKRHVGACEKSTEQQMQWLRMICDHIAASIWSGMISSSPPSTPRVGSRRPVVSARSLIPSRFPGQDLPPGTRIGR
ncbi:type I restriction-modification enzyme R subunit C-terminal domain-containing protein [Thermodesulfobacteriota bacterium]